MSPSLRTIKILAVGHSIVKGASDGNEISETDLRPRPPTPNAPHIPEGGWNYSRFGLKPRWGDGSTPENTGGPGWVVRAADFLPAGAVQVFNEGYSGGTAADWDPQGGNFVGRIFDRADEPLPRDLHYAVIALMANDLNTPPDDWKERMGRIVDFLSGRAIRSVLVYDWFRGVGTGQYHTGDSTSRYDEMGRRTDELVGHMRVPPPLDLRTVSEHNYKRQGATFYSDMEAWHAHPNTAGMIAAARILAAHLKRFCEFA
jgi:hypothetical protein